LMRSTQEVEFKRNLLINNTKELEKIIDHKKTILKQITSEITSEENRKTLIPNLSKNPKDQPENNYILRTNYQNKCQFSEEFGFSLKFLVIIFCLPIGTTLILFLIMVYCLSQVIYLNYFKLIKGTLTRDFYFNFLAHYFTSRT